MIYIVTWCILNMVSDPIPPSADKFGREEMMVTLAYRAHTVEDCGHEKYFVSRKEAFEFYVEAKDNEAGYSWRAGLSQVKIDSLKQ